MHEGDGRHKVLRVSTRLDPDKPEPLRWTNSPNQPLSAFTLTGQLLPPEERRVKDPFWRDMLKRMTLKNKRTHS